MAMLIGRKQFLVRLGALLGAGTLGAVRPGPRDAASACPLPSVWLRAPCGAARQEDWEAVRQQFDLAPDSIHLAGLLLASHPRPVREAIERHRQALDLNPPFAVEQSHQLEEEVRQAAATYLG